jgi:hypothetical protein
MQKPFMEGDSLTRIAWRCGAVVSDSSVEFAKELERQLNSASSDGFSLAQMIGRPVDNGLILVHQKATVLSPGPKEGPQQAGAERLQ